jgi:hypothetical protein
VGYRSWSGNGGLGLNRLLAWTIWIRVGANWARHRCSLVSWAIRCRDFGIMLYTSTRDGGRTRRPSASGARRWIQLEPASHPIPQPLYLTHQTSTHFLQVSPLGLPSLLFTKQLVHLALDEHQLILHSFVIEFQGSGDFLESDIRVNLVGFVLS